MPVFALTDALAFPPPSLATEQGLLAVGGDLSVARLRLAYREGIFPWYSEGRPILWWSPDPRLVLFPSELYVGRSLRKAIRRGRYRLSMDTAFRAVIEACARVPRPGQEGTWITRDMIEAYVRLHEAGIAHSVEAWDEEGDDGDGGGVLVGGVYGVAIGRAFFGESMFARAPDASKVAFARLVQQLQAWGYHLIDCQVVTEHLLRFGAREIDREEFLDHLAVAVDEPGHPAPWVFDPSP